MEYFQTANDLYDLGQYEEAIMIYDQALQVNLEDDKVWFRRGIALGNLGRYEEAMDSLDHALEIQQNWHEVTLEPGSKKPNII